MVMVTARTRSPGGTGCGAIGFGERWSNGDGNTRPKAAGGGGGGGEGGSEKEEGGVWLGRASSGLSGGVFLFVQGDDEPEQRSVWSKVGDGAAGRKRAG